MLVEEVVEVDLATELAVLVLLADVDVVGEVGAGLDEPGVRRPWVMLSTTTLPLEASRWRLTQLP